MSITKVAFIRGVAHTLQRAQVTGFNDLDTINKIASSAVPLLSVEPAVSEVPQQDVFKIAQYFAQYDGALAQHNKTASVNGGPRAMYASHEQCVGDMLHKVARIVTANITGTSVSQDQPDNTLNESASVTNLGMAEQQRRPEGYANVPLGGANFSEPQAARVGVEQPHPHQQQHDAMTSNSVNDASKAAALRASLAKMASGVTGTSVSQDQPQNSIMEAASVTNLGMAEQQRRPEGYANVPLGGANFSEPQAARVGVEQPHPHQQQHDAMTSNSVNDASKAAAWQQLYRTTKLNANQKLASQYGIALSDEDQDYLTRHLMSQPPHAHDGVLAKTASHVRAQNTGYAQ